ncbi:MAG TPA: protein kinase, partial [Thermoanaerobaculia bacterium]|nr:protein kinase [Thermoanaerobaculia bacterium]
MSLSPGAAVGPYEILAPLGAGGMGQVYRARDTKLERDVAVKILPPEFASSAEHLRRFEQEARAASALNHPNIVTIYDVGRTGSVAWIAMELVEGQNLRALTRNTRLSRREQLRIAAKIADGLAAAHERGIVHRDLKPENVMITGDGFVKILDFGLAKLVRMPGQSDATVPHTTPGSIFGTVSYMSPEQAGGRPADFRSDQFSLGTIIYELIAGKRPFDRDTGAETMTAIIREDATPLSSVAEDVPFELERIVSRCLAKQPHERYGSTKDLAHDLREVRDSLSTSTSSRRKSGQRPVPVRRVSFAVAGIAAVLLGVVAFLGYRHSQQQRRIEGHSTLAVLPFQDLGGSGSRDSLADGMAETISATLAHSRALRVIGPFDGVPVKPDTDPKKFARLKGATVVLRGSVQRAGEQLRITYSLLDVVADEQLAADSLTTTTRDVFAAQDTIARRILAALKRDPSRAPAIPKADEIEPADRAACLEAVGKLAKATDVATVTEAIAILERILRNTRDSPRVNDLLARGYLSKYLMTREPASLEQAALYSARARELAPSSVDARITSAEILRLRGRTTEAEEQFRSVLNADPSSFGGMLGLAETLAAGGRAAEAERYFERALELRPDYPHALNRYGAFSFRRGEYEKAARLYAKLAELQPESPRGLTNLGAAYQMLGRYDEARSAFERAIAISPTAPALSNLGTCNFFLGRY